MNNYIPAPAPKPANVPAAVETKAVTNQSDNLWNTFDLSAVKKQVPFIRLGSQNSKDAKDYPHIVGCIYSSLSKEVLAQPGQPVYFMILGIQRYINTVVCPGQPHGQDFLAEGETLYSKRVKAQNADNFQLTPYGGVAYGGDKTLHRKEEVYLAVLPLKSQGNKHTVSKEVHLISFSNRGLDTARELTKLLQANQANVQGPLDLLFALSPEQHVSKIAKGKTFVLLGKPQCTLKNPFKENASCDLNDVKNILDALEREYKAQDQAPVAQAAQAAPVMPQAPQVAPVMPQAPQVAPVMPQAPQAAPVMPQAPQVAPAAPVVPQATVDQAVHPFHPSAAPAAPVDNTDMQGVVSNEQDLGTVFQAQGQSDLQKMETDTNKLFEL